jgi:hypothetical protein
MKRSTPPNTWCRMAAVAALMGLWAQPQGQALAQDLPPAPAGTSRGENFSANKSPSQLFASDCTGSGCHKGPQGLGKGYGAGGLTGFLREHYTNSRESAASLANYLLKIPGAPEPREARTPRGGRPAAAAAPAPAPAPGGPTWGESIFSSEPKPAPNEARAPRQQPAGRASRAAARPDDDPAAPPAPPPVQRRQPAAAAAAVAVEAPPAPPPAPEVTAAPPPPVPKQFDIFD